MKKSVLIFVFILVAAVVNAQKPLFKFGDEIDSESISAGKKQKADLFWKSHWCNTFGKRIRKFCFAHRMETYEGRWKLRNICME